MPGLKLPAQNGLQPTGFGSRASHLRSLQHRSSLLRQNSNFAKQFQHEQRRNCSKRVQTSRCQASDGNGKPGMLWGIRNPFHGLGFGLHPAENESDQSEPEVQQAPAPEAAKASANTTPWKEWNQISYHVQLALRMDYIHNPSTAAARLCYHNSVSSIALHPRMASNNHASELVRQAECVERLVMMSAKFGDEVVITLHYFDKMDDCAQKMEDLDQTLVQATLLERFSEAAKVKKQMDDINFNDVVEQVLEEYSDAVEAEDYVKAAKLRDAAAAGLPGWWVAENKEDPTGHLLHIVPGFSRYVGYAFSPKDLARAEGLPTDDTLTMMQPTEDLQPVPLEEVGSPVIELFLKRNAEGELQQQGTALSISPEVLSKMHSSLETELSSLDPNKVTVEERKDADGASVISISVNMTSQEMPVSVPGQPSDFSFPLSLAAAPSGREAVDTNSTLTDAEVLDLQRLPAKITQISRDKLEVSLQPLTAEDQAEQEKEHRPELVYDSRDHDSDDDEDEEQVAVSIEGNPFLAVLDTASSNTDSIPGAISEVVTRQIKKLFPGQVISPEELEGLMNKDLQKASDSQPSSSSSGLNRDTASGSNAAPTASTSSDNTLNMSIDEIASTSGRETDAPADDSLPSWETVVGQVLQVVQQLKRVAPKPGDSTEEKQQHMDLMQKLDEAEETLSPQAKSTSDPKSRPKSKSRTSLPPPSTPLTDSSKPDHTAKIEELYEALRGQADAKAGQSTGGLGFGVQGSAETNVNEIAGKLAGEVIQGALNIWNGDSSKVTDIMKTATGEMEGKVMKYRRLKTDFVSTDPFTGLFLAAFGNHGPEMLQLQRQLDPDDDTVEWVIGTKLTGDSNVPAGEVSFKAKIGRAGRLGSPDMYNPEMGVIARYRGSGCVAQPGFQQPTWVEGELLHLNGHGTRGAELGFVWNADKNSFLMAVLKRVDLNDHDE